MQLDESKTLRQEVSINKWRNNKGIGTLLLCPRFGKTRIGIEINNRIIQKNNNSKILILTPSEYIKRYWKSHFEKDIENTTILSADEFINKENLSDYYDLVIVDEVHKFLSEVRYEKLCILREKSRFWLQLLGITPPEKGKGMIENLAPIIDEITQQEAIKNNWIAPSIEYNLGLDFTKDDELKYIRYSNIIREHLEIFKNSHKRLKFNNIEIFKSDFDVIYGCYTGKKLPHAFIEGKVFREQLAKEMGWSLNLDLSTDYGRQRDLYWNPNKIYDNAKQFQFIVKQRNELMGNNDIKLKTIVDIVNKYNIPTIVFSESIDFVTKVADTLGSNAIAYHSNIESRPIWDFDNNDWFRYKSGEKKGEIKKFGKDSIKKETIEGMISGKYKYLITAKALDEGLTIPNLELVIIAFGSTNPIQQGQRSARGSTIDINNKFKQTKIFNLYFKDIITISDSGDIKFINSRDKQKLHERQTTKAIELINLDEIS
jgi:superfamily II DNA or RNA helicase